MSKNFTILFLVIGFFVKSQAQVVVNGSVTHASIISKCNIEYKSSEAGFSDIRGNIGDHVAASLEVFEYLSFTPPKEIRFSKEMISTDSDSSRILMASFYRYVSEKIKYPLAAKKMRITGVAYVFIEVDSDGNIITANSLTDSREDFSRTVIDALLNSPPVLNKATGYNKFVLPVIFRIDKKRKPKMIIPSIPDNSLLMNEIIVTTSIH
jgi:hypothetical protein